jgi:hypothetical protein
LPFAVYKRQGNTEDSKETVCYVLLLGRLSPLYPSKSLLDAEVMERTALERLDRDSCFLVDMPLE